jgi:hypothetical protein
MRLIIEARLSDGDSDTVNDGDGVLAVVERRDCSLAQLGLTLAEGRSLLAKVHPLSKALTNLVTPELEYLQAKWAAHLPYRQATAMLKEVLPLDKGISFSGTRGRIHTLEKELDADIERDIAKLPQTVADVQVRESSHVASVSVDSARLRHCDSVGGQGRHVNIVAGRATFTDGPPKLYAYVHKEVTSAGARLDQFLRRNGVASDERVTVISDDAGELLR